MTHTFLSRLIRMLEPVALWVMKDVSIPVFSSISKVTLWRESTNAEL